MRAFGLLSLLFWRISVYIPYPAQLCAVLAFGLTGCVGTRDAGWPEARPLGEAIPAYRPAVSIAEPPNISADSTLALSDALALALLHNLDLRAFAWEVRAREAHMLQAGLPPNPEIGGEVENFNGSGSLGSFDAAEVTFGLSQLVELGGDRQRRKQVAAGERNLAGWNYETVRLDVLTETTQAFAAVLAAQERLNLSDTLREQAEQFYETVLARVDAGKVSALEERRALVVLSKARIEHQKASRDLTRARMRLSSTWGAEEPQITNVEGALEAVAEVPDYDVLVGFIERNPDVARWRDEMALRRADVALEKAARIPDPILGIGTRRLRDLGANALTAGISIPLPIFNRNQGAIKAAEYRIQVAEETRRATLVLTHQLLIDAYQRLLTAEDEVTALRDEVLPSARESSTATREGYREGKFDLLTVLDAQRTFFEATNQYIDALETYHLTRAEVERLLGTPLSEL